MPPRFPLTKRRWLPLGLILLSLFLLPGQRCLPPRENNTPNNAGDNADENTDQSISVRDEVLAILQRHRDAVYPTVPAEDRQAVEQYAAGYPLEAPAGTVPVIVTSSGDTEPKLTPTINRRDWAYARQGMDYTLEGLLGEGRAAKLDTGFWCQLEAALLRPDEPEHLANVAFHLNLRTTYEDSRSILQYARQLDPNNVPVRNNLAFALSGLGDAFGAINEELQALGRRPGSRFLLGRLASYYELAGLPNEAQYVRSIRDLAVPADRGPTPQPELSAAAASVLVDVFALIEPMMQEVNAVLESLPPATDWVASFHQLSGINDTEARCDKQMWDQYGNTLDYYVQSCTFCNLPAAHSRYQLQLTERSQVLAAEMTQQSQAAPIITKHLQEGVDKIRAAAGLSDGERLLLTKWWQQVCFDFQTAFLLGVRDAEADLQSTIAAGPQAHLSGGNCQLASTIQIDNDPCAGLLFCGRLSIWFGIGSFSMDLSQGKIELTLGQGWQFKVGYNLNTDTPLVGVGYGVNLDGILDAGAIVTFDGRQGLELGLDLGAPGPFALPVGDTTIPIVHLGAGMN